jgi:hypothetical protein
VEWRDKLLLLEDKQQEDSMQMCLLVKAPVELSTPGDNSPSLLNSPVDTLLPANHSPQSNQTPVVKEILPLSPYHPAAFKKESDKDDSGYESASASEDLASNLEFNPVFKDIAPVKQKHYNHQGSSSSKLPQPEPPQPTFIWPEYYEKQKEKAAQTDTPTPTQHTSYCNHSTFAESVEKGYGVMKDMLHGIFHSFLKKPPHQTPSGPMDTTRLDLSVISAISMHFNCRQ